MRKKTKIGNNKIKRGRKMFKFNPKRVRKREKKTIMIKAIRNNKNNKKKMNGILRRGKIQEHKRTNTTKLLGNLFSNPVKQQMIKCRSYVNKQVILIIFSM